MRVRSILALALCAIAACRFGSVDGVRRVTPIPGGGAPVEHQQIDPKTGKPLHEWSTIAVGDKPSRKHGKESVMRPDGSKEWERDWDHGQPAGVWRSWYANGQMRSECFFDGPTQERPMTFWFDNGQRRMQGPAQDGVRCGHWTVWFANGQVAEEGAFGGNRREGEWKAWSEDGKRSFVRVYQHDVRIEEREGEPAPAPASSPEAK
ncbi:MAG: hypothetical protein IPJ19_09255 [Planctomycetes bacterium]|nr:hypothetical protein [Planctomycetota bacterium]